MKNQKAHREINVLHHENQLRTHNNIDFFKLRHENKKQKIEVVIL